MTHFNSEINPEIHKKTIAVFDFDCTITTTDTLLPFLYSLKPAVQNIYNSIKLMPVLCAYKTGFLDNHTAKQSLLKVFLKNFSYRDLQQRADIFACEKIPLYIKPEAAARIRWHQSQGHPCILISAGLEIYLKPWAEVLGFEAVLATKLLVENQIITGAIDGKNCFGPEKVSRLENFLGQDTHSIHHNFTVYAYGDSRGDRELLALADHQFYRYMP